MKRILLALVLALSFSATATLASNTAAACSDPGDPGFPPGC